MLDRYYFSSNRYITSESLLWMQAVCFREIEDVASLEEKLGRPLSKQEKSRIGVSKLRLFLEELLQKRFNLFLLVSSQFRFFRYIFYG